MSDLDIDELVAAARDLRRFPIYDPRKGLDGEGLRLECDGATVTRILRTVTAIAGEGGESQAAAWHISDACRARGDDAVVADVLGGLESRLRSILQGWRGHDGLMIHVRLTIERLAKEESDGMPPRA